MPVFLCWTGMVNEWNVVKLISLNNIVFTTEHGKQVFKLSNCKILRKILN